MAQLEATKVPLDNNSRRASVQTNQLGSQALGPSNDPSINPCAVGSFGQLVCQLGIELTSKPGSQPASRSVGHSVTHSASQSVGYSAKQLITLYVRKPAQ